MLWVRPAQVHRWSALPPSAIHASRRLASPFSTAAHGASLSALPSRVASSSASASRAASSASSPSPSSLPSPSAAADAAAAARAYFSSSRALLASCRAFSFFSFFSSFFACFCASDA